MPHTIQDGCTKCGACLPECPTQSIIEGKKKFLIDADTCEDCRSCVAVCPVDVIHPLVTAATKAAAAQPQKPLKRTP